MAIQYQRIFITRTQKEWELIELRLSQINRSNMNAFINSRICGLEKEYADCPQNIYFGGNKITKRFYIPPQTFEILSKLNEITGTHESAIVNKLIIEPLLIFP